MDVYGEEEEEDNNLLNISLHRTSSSAKIRSHPSVSRHKQKKISTKFLRIETLHQPKPRRNPHLLKLKNNIRNKFKGYLSTFTESINYSSQWSSISNQLQHIYFHLRLKQSYFFQLKSIQKSIRIAQAAVQRRGIRECLGSRMMVNSWADARESEKKSGGRESRETWHDLLRSFLPRERKR